MGFSKIDYGVFCTNVILIVGLGLWVSREKKGHRKDSRDYFLAGMALPWWAIGASLIAANISAEQFTGMSGSGFAIGLAIASYEWMSALTLIIVGKFFLPIFIEKQLYTIPEFVERRFGITLKTILAVFWIALFVFVNLTSVLFLGGKAIDTIIGSGDGSLIIYAIVGLAFVAGAYSLHGGLSAVAWTDVVQVALLVVGGSVTSVLTLSHVTPEGGLLNGLSHLLEVAPEKFQMFQYIQEYTGLVSPGILAVFLMGLFWKQTTNQAAIVGIIASVAIALFLKTPAVDLPWMDQMLYTLLIAMVVVAGVSMTTSQGVDDAKGIPLTAKIFETSVASNVSSYVIIIILAIPYTVFW